MTNEEKLKAEQAKEEKLKAEKPKQVREKLSALSIKDYLEEQKAPRMTLSGFQAFCKVPKDENMARSWLDKKWAEYASRKGGGL